MKIILSIKPEFAEKIFEGTKSFEFRRSIFKKNRDVKTVIVYASAPISKIIGEFDIDSVIHSDILSLWEKTKSSAGITKEYYLEYFEGKELGFALKIKGTRLYESYKDIQQEFGVKPPRSFVYVND